MEKMKHCNNRLKEIALKPDPPSTVERLELLIHTEEMEGNPCTRVVQKVR